MGVHDLLAVVGFGDALSGACVTIASRQLGSVPLAEVWRTALPIEKGRIGEVSFAANGAVLIGAISAESGETDVAASRIYEQIVDAAVAVINEQGIQTAIHYPVPVHLQPAYASMGLGTGSFPESERAASEVLTLPIYPALTDEQCDRVCEAVREVVGGR